MAKVLIEEQNLSDIATSIRAKNGTQDTYKPSEMSGAIDDIETTPDLETKTVTITENGTTTITPTQGKDGLSSVSVTTNVSGGGADKYFREQPLQYDNGLVTLIKEVPTVDLTNVTSFNFSGAKFITKYNGFINTSGLTSMQSMFNENMRLEELPFFDTSNVTNMSYAFKDCIAVASIPLYDTSKVTDMNSMFYTGYSDGQYGTGPLTDIPVLNTSKVTNMQNMYYGRRELNDTTLDNILQMCINATSYASTKTLSYLGFVNMRYEYPVSRIQALPHYQDFINAGWTIGY